MQMASHVKQKGAASSRPDDTVDVASVKEPQMMEEQHLYNEDPFTRINLLLEKDVLYNGELQRLRDWSLFSAFVEDGEMSTVK